MVGQTRQKPAYPQLAHCIDASKPTTLAPEPFPMTTIYPIILNFNPLLIPMHQSKLGCYVCFAKCMHEAMQACTDEAEDMIAVMASGLAWTWFRPPCLRSQRRCLPPQPPPAGLCRWLQQWHTPALPPWYPRCLRPASAYPPPLAPISA